MGCGSPCWVSSGRIHHLERVHPTPLSTEGICLILVSEVRGREWSSGDNKQTNIYRLRLDQHLLCHCSQIRYVTIERYRSVFTKRNETKRPFRCTKQPPRLDEMDGRF